MKAIVLIIFALYVTGCAHKVTKNSPEEKKIFREQYSPSERVFGKMHNRAYLKRQLADLNLNIDSLQNVVNQLNRYTYDKEWEYQISILSNPVFYRTTPAGSIHRFYKSHKNIDSHTGRTIYGEELRRMSSR